MESDMSQNPIQVEDHIYSFDNFISVTNNSPLAHIALDRNGYVTVWNNAAEKIFGWKKEEVINQLFPIIPTFDEINFKNMFNFIISGNSITGLEAKRLRKDQTLIDCLITTAPLYNGDGTINGYMAIIEDITDLKDKEKQLSMTNKELEAFKYVLDKSSTVSITDAKGTILFVNELFCKISKYERNELIGRNHRMVNSKYHPKAYFEQMWSTITKGQVWKGEVCNKAKDGTIWWGDATIVPFLDEQGKPYQYVAVRSDITNRKIMEQKIYQMAYYDYLTHLPNRRLFDEHMEQEFKEAQSSNGKFSIVLLGLHGLKFVNDSLGTAFGDQLLMGAAQRLNTYLDTMNLKIYRLEGNELVILLPNEFVQDIHQISDEILCLFEEPFAVKEYELFLSVNMGISIYPYDGDSIQSVIRNAYSALYQAKDQGTNTYQITSPNMSIASYKRFTLKNDLRRALKNNEFFLHYQPRIETKTNKIIGAEALIRWNHPEWGLVSPVEFITLAEEEGLIGSIGEMVLLKACQQNSDWQRAGLQPITVSVNFSVTQFLQSDLTQMVERILKQTELHPKWLEIEITETAIMKDETAVLKKIKKLQKMGINIAIDDFGTGYASLSYLKKLKANTIKIDRCFIKDIPNETDSTEIVKATVQLAKKLNIRTVAEGVEEEEQLTFLNEMNCDEIQGYLYSKPLPVQEFQPLLMEKFCLPN